MNELVNGTTICTRKDFNGELYDIHIGDIVTGVDYHGPRFGIINYDEFNGVAYLSGLDGYSDEYLLNVSDIIIRGTLDKNPAMLEEDYDYQALLIKSNKNINIINDDILNAEPDSIIVHQVNCMGVMGAGLAKQIKQKFPKVYTEYQEKCKTISSKKLLGKVQYITSGDYLIANLFGQEFYGHGRRFTDYTAVKYGLEDILATARREHLTVAIPYKIGCGLAGGEWPVIEKIINDLSREYNEVKINIYKI